MIAVVAATGAVLSCPTFSLGYVGSPWTQHFNESLPAGEYYFGALCGGFGNGTVTQAIELVYP